MIGKSKDLLDYNSGHINILDFINRIQSRVPDDYGQNISSQELFTIKSSIKRSEQRESEQNRVIKNKTSLITDMVNSGNKNNDLIVKQGKQIDNLLHANEVLDCHNRLLKKQFLGALVMLDDISDNTYTSGFQAVNIKDTIAKLKDDLGMNPSIVVTVDGKEINIPDFLYKNILSEILDNGGIS